MATETNDVDLEWLVFQGAAAMRERGTIAGVIAQLEAGGPGDSGNLGEDGSYIHPYEDRQLGTGRCAIGDVERHRWLSRAWFACSERTRALLILRYTAPRAAFRSDEGFGARDRYVEGSDGKTGRHAPTRTGVEAQLGELAAVALQVYEKPGDLLEACHAFNGDAGDTKRLVSGKQAEHGRTIRRARRQAENALDPAWREWWAAKEAADPMRPTRQRRTVLPAHQPREAVE